jgi:hypothetical protein
MSENQGHALTLQELPDLRHRTEAVSRFLREQITAHLATLRPLFAAERVFGKYAGGKIDVAEAERALTELQQNYKAFTRKPYDLPENFDTNWLTLVGNALELHPWEYVHEVQGKQVTLTSPVRWAINYRTNYNLAQVKTALDGKEAVRPDYLRQFVVNTLVLHSILNRNPGVPKLFQDLRYELKSDTTENLKGLPVFTVTSNIKSFRPADELISAAIAFSGVPSFIELLDIEATKQTADPLKSKLESFLN